MEDETTAEARRSSWVFEAAKTVVYALLIAVFIRTFLFQPFNIPSSSMEETLLIGDYLMVTKFSSGYSNHSFPWSPDLFKGRIWAAPAERGDVVVFRLPARPWEDYIKRVVGLPGDRIQMIEGVLHINGAPVKLQRIADYIEVTPGGYENRVNRYVETLPNGVSYSVLDRSPDYPFDDTQEFVVPKASYFMMGDNRDNSNDSRVPDSGVGFVPEENIVGRADIILFSTDGNSQLWEFWKWPSAIRYGRFFKAID